MYIILSNRLTNCIYSGIIAIMDIDKLLELNHLAQEDGKRYARKRHHYTTITQSLGKHFVGIIGPRGAGKTVLLKQIASETRNSFYLSVDTLEDNNLFDIAKTLFEKYKIKLLLLDEVHFQKNVELDLKKIFDFLNIRIVFTSSVALAMLESAYDLSRRVQLITIFPFSFREYLLFKKDIDLPTLTIDDIIEKKWSSEHLQYGYSFEEYLKGALHPFALEEGNITALLKNILQKIIHKDIPKIAKLHTDELSVIEKMLAFVGRSPVDGINYTSISKNLGITKYKAEQYIQLLRRSFVLNPSFPFGTNVLKEPKVLMFLPYRLLYKDYAESIGAIREDFFAEAMTMAHIPFSYLKTKRGEKTPDFLIKAKNRKIVIEVGGKGKGKEQFKGIVAKNKIRLVHSDDVEGNKRPLFLLGYLV